MTIRRLPSLSGRPRLALTVATVVALGLASPLCAQQAKRKNPASKVYVADVGGEAMIDTGETVEDLSKRSVYTAEGTVIETKKPEKESDRSRYFSTMVYSNGTGAFFDADTRVEVRRFAQEPFQPNRTDVEVEPSISQTQAFVARGAVGLCTSKLVAGSVMNYQTPLGSVNIRGRKVVIEAQNDVTKISMLEGDSTVRGGPQDLGGHTIHAGEQAIIRRGAPGQPNIVQIMPIPPAEAPALDDKVAMACMAKKTVYFDVKETPTEGSDRGDSAAGGNAGSGDGNSGGTPNGPISVFDGSTDTSGTTREIIPIEVVPINLPTEFTVSPATLGSPSAGARPGS